MKTIKQLNYMDDLKNGVTIHLTCESSAEYAEIVARAIFKIANKQVVKAEEKLEELKKQLNSTQKELDNIKGQLLEEQSESKKVKAKALNLVGDVDNLRKDLQNEQNSHATTREELMSEKTKTEELSNKLKHEIEEHGNTKNSLTEVKTKLFGLQQDLVQEKKKHDTTTGLLKQEKEETERLKGELTEEKTKRQEQENLIVEQIKSGFNEIVSLLMEDYDKLEDEQKNLKAYLKDIVEPKGGNYGWSEANSIDDLIYSFKFGDGYLSRIINLVWWSGHHNLEYQMSCITKMMNITSILERMQYLLLAIGHTLTLPDSKVGENISSYNKYDVESSHFMNIFDESYQTGTMCEVYLPALDGNNGKCYIFYK